MAITRIKNNQITDATITNVKIASSTLTGDLMNPNLTFNSNLTLNGNLTVTGNVTAVQSTTTQITDPLLTLGLGNGGTSYDLGLVLIRGSGGNRFIGWKENDSAFVFINTTEDGTTTGNIATTAFANAKLGNIAIVGSSTLGGITVSANTVSAGGALTVRSDAGSISFSNAVTITGATILSSTLSVVGAATVASLTSNAGIIATTGSFSGNLTGSALTVNNSATIATTLGVTGNTTVGNLTTAGNISAGYLFGNGSLLTGVVAGSSSTAVTVTANAQPNITSVGVLSSLTSSGNITASGLTINNSATIGTTLGVTGNINGSSATLTGSATIGSTLGVTGNINGSSLTLSGSEVITGTSRVIAGIQNTAIGNVTASTGQFTTVSATGNITGAALTSNGSATIGSTLGVTGNINGTSATLSGSLVTTGPGQHIGGLQNTPIGNATASTGQFTTVSATGNITGAALTSNGSATIGSTLGVTGNINGSGATLTGNATVGNVSTQALGASGIVTITNATDSTGTGSGALQVTGGASINKNLYVSGNIYAGNIIAIQANTLSVQDPLLYLTANTIFPYNYSIGFFSQYQGGNPGNVNANIYQHTGFVRDHTDLTWKLFSNVVAEPTTTVDFTNAQWEQIRVGNTTITGTASVSGNATVGNLTTAGNITALTYFGDGSKLTGVAAGSSTLAQFVTGNAQPNITSVGILSSLNSSGNITASGLTINNSATIGTTLGVTGNINGTSATLTGSATIGSTLGVTGNINGSGATLSGSTTIGSTLGVTGNINGSGITLTGSLRATGPGDFDGGLQSTPIGNASASTGQFTTLSATGNITGAALTSNASITAITTLSALGGIQNTPIGNATASTGKFTTLETTANATVNQLTVNSTATVGSTLGVTGNINGSGITLTGSLRATGPGDFDGGLQSTPIGNASASTGAFTTLTASGATTFTSATDSTSPTTGAVVITGGLGVGLDFNVTTEANLGNVNINNVTLTSKTTNTGLTINPNGTGQTTINSGLNASRTVINGTTNANTFVVSGTQVGIATNTFVTGATFQINALDSMLIPAGATGDRPGSPTAGMLRYNTSSGVIEWWTGSTWGTPSGSFTVVTANTQTGNGVATVFTLPVSNATTAGTLVSINGVVQQPTTAYSITGANVTFTEAPTSTDVIDFRVFTTTAQVTSVTDTYGNTGLFFDLPTSGSAITTFKTSGVESFSIQANSQARFAADVRVVGNILPSSNATSNIGSSTLQFNTVFAKATSAQYADLAENYAADQVYEPGTVVHFGGAEEITKCVEDMCQRVAGVVSTNPAYIMNSGQTGIATAIALQGRVPTKVRGQVRKGDMMVSAGDGYARAEANPKIGSVIGKALADFDGLEGIIEVVVGRL